MSCYFIAQITIHDRRLYQRYLEGFDAIFRKYRGRVLVVDDAPTQLEGRRRRRRIVVIRFRDRREARRWYDSPAYRTLSRFRKGAAACDIMFVRGRS